MGIFSHWFTWIISLTFLNKILFFILIAMISPGIYFIGLFLIYFGWGIIAFILQWIIVIIEIPINTITIIVETITYYMTHPWSLGWRTGWAIDFNFDGENTSIFNMDTNINWPSWSGIQTYSWFIMFTVWGPWGVVVCDIEGIDISDGIGIDTNTGDIYAFPANVVIGHVDIAPGVFDWNVGWSEWTEGDDTINFYYRGKDFAITKFLLPLYLGWF